MKLSPYEHGHRAFLVAIEGADGLGKTTQAARLAVALQKRGYDTAAAVAPASGYLYYREIRALLADGASKNPLLLQALMLANRVDWQARALNSLLSKMKFIVLDRWNASGHVYGRASGLEDQQVDLLMSGIYDADLTIVLAGEPFRQEGRDEYERDTDFQRKVRAGYEQWVEANAGSAITIVANQVPAAVTRDLVIACLLSAEYIAAEEVG